MKMKMHTSMKGLQKWIHNHPRNSVAGYFTVYGHFLTNREVKRMVDYAVQKGYETEADIPESEYNNFLDKKGGNQ